MKKTLVISGSTIALIILTFLGIYFVNKINKGDDLLTQKHKLQNTLTLAQEKLKKEKENLEIITQNLKDSFPLAVNIQDQMRKSSAIVEQTDFMFKNPYGPNPELIIKNFASVAINNQRKNINLFLEEWKKKTDISSIDKINLAESEQIKKDAELIKTFIEDLAKLVNGLTPANSGLPQFQIDVYVDQLPPVAAIDEILVSIENTIENSNVNNTETNNNLNPFNPPSNTPPVTSAEVIIQQQVVVETQTEVDTVQEQLTEVEEQIKQTLPNPVITPIPTGTTINPNPENQDTNNYNNEGIYVNERIIEPSTIIIQPGTPRLIQGTDPF